MARNPDPQFTTQGAYRQLDETVARYGLMEGPNEGQRGIAMAAAPSRQKARRKTVRKLRLRLS